MTFFMTHSKQFVIKTSNALRNFGYKLAHSAIWALGWFWLKSRNCVGCVRRYWQIRRYWAGDIGPPPVSILKKQYLFHRIDVINWTIKFFNGLRWTGVFEWPSVLWIPFFFQTQYSQKYIFQVSSGSRCFWTYSTFF